MAVITSYSRISHHTLTTAGATFSVPLQEDFTLQGSTMSWTSSDLCLSEFGVNEADQKVYIRIGATISEISTTSVGGALFESGSGFGSIQSIAGGNTASAAYSFAEGYGTKASGSLGSHAEGGYTIANGVSSHAEGGYTLALSDYSHAEGLYTTASNDAAHAEGYITKATGIASHAEGQLTVASGANSHAEGNQTISSGISSHSEGFQTLSSGPISHSEGNNSVSSGTVSHAEGTGTIASGYSSHSEGDTTIASGEVSHAEGLNTRATDTASHSEGYNTRSTATASHSGGSGSTASHYAEWSRSSVTQGQYGVVSYYGTTTNTTPTEIFLDGSSRVFSLIPNSSYSINVQAIAQDPVTGDSKEWTGSGFLIKNISGVTTAVGATTLTSTNSDAAFATITLVMTANNANDTIKMEVTGLGGTTINWFVKLEYAMLGNR